MSRKYSTVPIGIFNACFKTVRKFFETIQNHSKPFKTVWFCLSNLKQMLVYTLRVTLLVNWKCEKVTTRKRYNMASKQFAACTILRQNRFESMINLLCHCKTNFDSKSTQLKTHSINKTQTNAVRMMSFKWLFRIVCKMVICSHCFWAIAIECVANARKMLINVFCV